MNQIPIPPANAPDKAALAKLAEQAAKSSAAGEHSAVAKTERNIDEIVYRLFDLNPKEVTHIENALKSTRIQSSDDDSEQPHPYHPSQYAAADVAERDLPILLLN